MDRSTRTCTLVLSCVKQKHLEIMVVSCFHFCNLFSKNRLIFQWIDFSFSNEGIGPKEFYKEKFCSDNIETFFISPHTRNFSCVFVLDKKNPDRVSLSQNTADLLLLPMYRFDYDAAAAQLN